MKILVVGAFKYHMYQEALCYGLEQNGAEVIRHKVIDVRPYGVIQTLLNGKSVWEEVCKQKPDMLFLYRVENIFPYIIKKVKSAFPQIVIAQYHNDDPFRKGFKRYIKSFHFLHYIKYSDLTYVYRSVNIEEAKTWGASYPRLFMSHFDSQIDMRELSCDDFKNKDGRVVFLGHWEDDDRKEYINACYENNIDLHVYGPQMWKNIFVKNGWPIEKLHSVVRGDEYRKTIQRSSIALAFFSKANRDEYTRRCFEIPISGTAILQPRTSMTSAIFKDGEDAILYSNQKEFVGKLMHYLSHEKELEEIAYNGYQLMRGGDFSEISRAKMVIQDYIKIKNEQS